MFSRLSRSFRTIARATRTPMPTCRVQSSYKRPFHSSIIRAAPVSVPSMTVQQQQIVKSTAPVLAQHGVAITSYFYKRMFKNHPELKNIFNQAHQRTGDQPTALAHAVYAYAANIDNLGVLSAAVTKIAHKHASLQIQADQYPIVGENLLASIKEVLGDAITPDIVDAWTAAYNQLAAILINAEAALYAETAAKKGGWNGWRQMKVVRKEAESNEVTSFYLQPVDGGALASYKPGQYISVKLWCESLQCYQPRQYSLSDYNEPANEYRISVKKHQDGAISPLLHTTINVGNVIDMSAPYGDFILEEGTNPVVMIAGGIGITPLLSMTNSVVKKTQRPIHIIHAVRNTEARPFTQFLSTLVDQHAHVKRTIFVEEVQNKDIKGQHYDHQGRISKENILSQLSKDSDIYLCGPIPFIVDVEKQLIDVGFSKSKIHSEVFGSETR